ncbi:MAG: EAL domain-containing protein [Pseudomonadota bacterium]
MNHSNPEPQPRWIDRIRGMSLKTRLILMTVGLFVASIWVLAFLSASVLHGELEDLLSEQQLADTRRVALQLDARLKDNIDGLTRAAVGLPQELSYDTLQPLLAQRPYLHIAFSAGIAVVGLDGVIMADYPVVPGRRGLYIGDRDYVTQVVKTGKPYIGKPVIGRALGRTVLTTAVPVFAANGQLHAVMVGFTDLNAPNFLGFVTDRSQIGQGEYFVMSLRDRIIIAATDSKRNLQPSPVRGLNLIYDRMADGFEGSGVAFSSEGFSKLYSGVRVPTTDWLVMAALPTEVAFGPVKTLKNYFYALAALLTLAATLLIGLMLRRLLAPLEAASQAMQSMTDGQTPLAPLPLVRHDEVGQLVKNFNQLITDRQRYEAALGESEQRFRRLVERAPDGIYIQAQGRFAYLNSAALALFGATSEAQLLGQPILERIHPDYREAVAQRIRRVNEEHQNTPPLEQVYLKLDGTLIDVEISAVPFHLGEDDGSLIFVRDITARKQTNEAIRLSEARFRSLFDHMLEGFAYCRMIFEQGKPVDFVLLEVNPAFARLTGLTDAVGKKISTLIPGYCESSVDLMDAYGRVAAGGAPEKLESHVAALAQWFSVSAYHADTDCFVAVFDIITRQKLAEAAQSRLNRALRLLSACNMALVHAEREQSLLEQICQLVVDLGGYQMAWVGYAEDDAEKTVRPVAQAGAEDGYLKAALISWSDSAPDLGPTGRAIATGETQVNHDFGTNPAIARWRAAAENSGFRCSIGLPLRGKQHVFGALAIYSAATDAFFPEEVALLQELAGDLAYGIETLRARSQRASAEEKLAFLAHHDVLTGLPNRLLLRDRFDFAMGQAERDKTKIAMLFLDLDNFKQINDSLGHAMGDQLLVALAERLRGCIRDSDTICRQGGDEFIILIGGLTEAGTVTRMAQEILDAIAEPFELAGHALTTTFSIGISLFPDDANDFDTLSKNADAALYHAKDSGKNAYSFFASGMNVDALAHMQLQGALRRALKNEEFLLHYQPQIDLTTGRIFGVEALVRWQPPDSPLVPPGNFIPVAEQSGLIIALGEWVLNEACCQAAAWQAAGLPPIVVAVNLSALQFRRGNILDTVTAALARSGLAAQWLELELTESILLQDVEAAMATLHSLKALGVQLSIDDFGTGYSSLSYLKRLAVDKLKIDQSFVRDLATDADDAAIVRAIVQLGHTLQLTVIAEGVETESQRAFLSAYGCDEAQGYLFSRPLTASAIEPLLRDGLQRSVEAAWTTP